MNKKSSTKKNSPKKELDDICTSIFVVETINTSNKPVKDKINLISKIIPYIKIIMKNQMDDSILLNDLVKQWKEKKFKTCNDYLKSMNMTTPDEKKAYMSLLLRLN